MGVFTKSILILLIAVSTPLIYRQFANDGTVKFMSSYYSNYKSIDQFLRRSANHIESAKDYLPDTEQLKGMVDNVNKQIGTLMKASSSSSSEPTTKASEKKSSKAAKEPKKKAAAAGQSIKYATCPEDEGEMVRLWTPEELVKYDGNSGEADVLLAFLGLVYNVTANAQHYGAGAEYNVFAGRDATRAFVTGNFTHDLNDDVSDIDESMYSHIESWISFYASTYPMVGRIIGKFYDSRGCSTGELARVLAMFNKLEAEKANASANDEDFPECNSEWNTDLKKGRVWCSTKSGGIERDWAGVPRVYSKGGLQRCACFNKDGPRAAEQAKVLSTYPDCNLDSFECPLESP